MDNMKILVIFTGGTIGSSVSDEHISIDRTKPYKLIKVHNRQYKNTIEFETVEPYSALSENNTGFTMKQLSQCVKEHINSGYDGIIVTHGTDTMQYMSAALSYTIGNSSIPICVVSSNYPIESENSNGVINFHAAIKFIEKKAGTGVWVVYKNDSELVKVHRGTRLLASGAYSDKVESIFGLYYGSFDSDFNFIPNPDYEEINDEISPLSANGLSSVSDSIMRIEPYPGMTYPDIDSNIKYILCGTYHSGTINSEAEETKKFLRDAVNKHIKVYVTGVYEGASYDSTKIFDQYDMELLKNAAPIAMYIKLWLALSMGIRPEDIMLKSLGGDIVHKSGTFGN